MCEIFSLNLLTEKKTCTRIEHQVTKGYWNVCLRWNTVSLIWLLGFEGELTFDQSEARNLSLD